MRRSFNRARAVVFPIAAIFMVAVWLSFVGGPQQAQLRKTERVYSVGKFAQPDQITAEIRKPSNDLFHVPIVSQTDRARVLQLGKIVNDFGNFVIAVGDGSISEERYGDGAYKIDTDIHLPGATFDPMKDPPAETVRPGSASKFGNGYYVVQLGGIASDDVLDSLRGDGLEVIQYVPNNAFLVYGDATSAAKTAENSRVRWVGEFAGSNKITPGLLTVRGKERNATYNIAVFSRADLGDVASEIVSTSGGELFGKMNLQHSYFNVVRIAMSPDQLERVASIPDVVRIDSWVKPTKEDERSSQIVAGNYTNTTTIAAPGYNPLSQFGVDGTGVTIAMSDDGVSIPGNGGFYLTATNVVDGNLRGSAAGATSGHGHLNASIISGASPFGILDPTGYNYGLGVAPKSHIVNLPFLNTGYTGTDADAANDAVTTAGPNTVLGTISNNSWGNGTNGNAYDSMAATYDGLARDASAAASVDPLLFVFSAGNLGASGLTRPKMAKNIIAVGSSENLRTELEPAANNIDDISSFSARGLAADGRVKPDIVAPGQGIAGSRAGTDCSGVASCFDANHSYSDGTSHAAPQVAGAAALFTQFWKTLNAGAKPSIALTKAAILLTGQEMGGVGATSTLPNGAEGWGRVNMKFMLNTGAAMKWVDQNVNFSSPGDNIVYTGKIVDGTKPFRVALVWTDPAAAVDPALVNDLDLTVTVNGNTYRGNAFSGGLSVAGGSNDTKNNVEQVWRTGDATNSPVTITVNAAALNGDGIIGNADATDQHFALVAYNFVDAPVTNFNISGRLTSAAGRGVAGAQVVLSNGGGVVATALSNTFGYYRFAFIPGSQAYTVSVLSKRYSFDSQNINLGSADLNNVDFTSTHGAP